MTNVRTPMNSLEQLFDTQLKADILRLFHNNVHRLSETAEQIAKRLGSNTAETERDLEDLASLGLLKKAGIMKKVYSFGSANDAELRDRVLKQLKSKDAVSPDVLLRARQVYWKDLPSIPSTKLSTRVATTSKEEPIHSPTPPPRKVPHTAYGPRTRIGIPGLDEVLCGGLPAGKIIMVVGEPGAGKTVLASQYLYNGINNFRENGLLVSMKDNRRDYVWEMNQFGWDFASAEMKGKFSFIDASPIRAPGEAKIGKLTIGRKEFSLLRLLKLVRNSALTINAKRIVVDSLSMLELHYLDGNKRRKAIIDTLEALEGTGATCMLTTDFTSIGLEPFMALEDFLRFSIIQFEKQLFHGVISMQTIGRDEGRRGMVRMIQIEKMKATETDRQPRPYRITDKGIEVFPQEI